MSREGSYERKKGRSPYAPHVRIYHWLLPTLLERLSGNGIKVLLYLMSFERGSNNGELFMSARMAAEGTGLTKKTVLACLHELDRQGFIRPAALGYFQVKGGPATKWRLTFLPAFKKPPTHEWKQAPANQKSWGENVHTAGVKITPSARSPSPAGVNSTPAPYAKRPNLAGAGGVKSSTQTIATGVVADPSKIAMLDDPCSAVDCRRPSGIPSSAGLLSAMG